jgi:hypothetical protein
MRRIVLVVILLLPAILGCGQDISSRIADLAKVLWKEFPKECFAAKEGHNIEIYDLEVPLSKVRPSLIDSVEAVMTELIPTANLVSVVNKRNGDMDSLNYSLCFDPMFGPNEKNYTQEGHHIIGGGFRYALFDTLDDTFYFQCNYLYGGAGKVKNKLTSEEVWYDISVLDDKLLQLRKQYPTKAKRLKWKGNDKKWSTYKGKIKASKYAIACDANRVFNELYDLIFKEYVLQYNGQIVVRHLPNRDFIHIKTLMYYYDDKKYYFDRDREIAIWVEDGKLMVLDVPVPTTVRDRDARFERDDYIQAKVFEEALGSEAFTYKQTTYLWNS